jgi:hypothetical protein
MASFVEILKIILPAFLVLLLALFFFDRITNQAKDKYQSSVKVNRDKIILPLKISACERLIVMLERIRPHSLVMRHNKGQMTSAQLQLELLKAVREEFEHNISMQMYVSERTWKLVYGAKEESLQLVKVASSQTKGGETALKLCEEIFILEGKVGSSAIDLALKALRLEIKTEF